jgi:hypothetical protein
MGSKPMPQLELEAARTAVVLPIPLPGALLVVVAPPQLAIYRCGWVRPCTTRLHPPPSKCAKFASPTSTYSLEGAATMSMPSPYWPLWPALLPPLEGEKTPASARASPGCAPTDGEGGEGGAWQRPM